MPFLPSCSFPTRLTGDCGCVQYALVLMAYYVHAERLGADTDAASSSGAAGRRTTRSVQRFLASPAYKRAPAPHGNTCTATKDGGVGHWRGARDGCSLCSSCGLPPMAMAPTTSPSSAIAQVDGVRRLGPEDPQGLRAFLWAGWLRCAP